MSTHGLARPEVHRGQDAAGPGALPCEGRLSRMIGSPRPEGRDVAKHDGAGIGRLGRLGLADDAGVQFAVGRQTRRGHGNDLVIPRIGLTDEPVPTLLFLPVELGSPLCGGVTVHLTSVVRLRPAEAVTGSETTPARDLRGVWWYPLGSWRVRGG